MRIARGFLALVLLLLSCLAGQSLSLQNTNSNSALQERAKAAVAAKDWDSAAKLYGEIVKADPKAGGAWFQLGMADYSLGKFKLAAEAFEHAQLAGFPAQPSLYNVAASYGRLDDKEKTLEWLQKLLAAKWSNADALRKDDDFAIVRDDPSFAAMLAQADKNGAPCKLDPKHREFDFWLGEWDVVPTQGGGKAGSSSVQSILNGCVVLENWTGLTGVSGKSFNVYNASLKKWQQFWNDSVGTVTLYEGQVSNGEMHYLAHSLKPDGKPFLQRLTFVKLGPDKVRQHEETSSDDGKTWVPSYDFTYNRRK